MRQSLRPDRVSVDTSHETLETAGDEGANEFANDNSGLLHAVEMCDAVEVQTYARTCDPSHRSIPAIAGEHLGYDGSNSDLRRFSRREGFPMSQKLDLNLPSGLVEVLTQISLVIAKGAAPSVGDVVQKIVPTMMVSAAQTLLAASGAVPPCTLAAPPEEIFATMDARTKKLRLECKHSPPHCWDWNGDPGSC